MASLRGGEERRVAPSRGGEAACPEMLHGAEYSLQVFLSCTRSMFCA